MVWAGAAGLGVTGCSSDPAKATADAGKKATSSSASSSSGDDGSSSSSSSSASSTSSSGSPDAGKDASSSGGALNSNPKKVSCKPAECSTDGAEPKFCCWAGGNAADGTCVAEGADCNGYNIACDEKADCIDGNVCCWGDGQTVCVDSCANAGTPGDNPAQPQMQLCKTDAECGAEKCGIKTCSIIADAANPDDKIDVSIAVCGKPANCK